MDKYILDENHKAVQEPDLLKWGKWNEKIENRRVANEIVNDKWRVSTVFLGIDHSFGEGEPLLFETMVFEGDDATDLDCARYSTWEQAVAGHAHMVEVWKARN